MPADRLLVFARRPAAGRVKTRLSPPLPPDEAAAVYDACLRDVISNAARERARLELWFDDGDDAAAYFAREFSHVRREAQRDGDLGERLCGAFDASFADGASRVVIIGSDAPTVPESVLSAAYDDLHEAEAVIAPTLDGGYYLIGLSAGAWPRAQRLFDGVPWSTPDVYGATIEAATEIELDVRVLPGWYDIDVIEDLRRARADLRPDSHLARWMSTAYAAGWLRDA